MNLLVSKLKCIPRTKSAQFVAKNKSDILKSKDFISSNLPQGGQRDVNFYHRIRIKTKSKSIKGRGEVNELT